MNIIKSRIVFSVASTPSPQAGYMVWGGLWTFASNSNNFPTPTMAGTLYVTTDEHGNFGDADYVAEGAWMVSNVDGASLFADFEIKF